MVKSELINLLKDPEVADVVREAVFGKPVKTPFPREDIMLLASASPQDSHKKAPKHLPIARIAWGRVPQWVNSILINPSREVWGCDRKIDPNFKQPIAGKYTLLCHDHRGYSDALLLDDCDLPLILDRGYNRADGGVQVFILTPKNLDEHVRKVGPPTIGRETYPEKDVIPWDVLDPRWKFAIRSPAGEAFVCQNRPHVVDFGWKLVGGTSERISGLLAGFAVGACPWHKSLQERPDA